MLFRTITSNLSTKVRSVTINGREWLIAPATSIVVGVLPGSDGSLFYPAKHVSRNPSKWDGIPLLINHPTLNGQPVSARYPGIVAANGVGFAYNSHFNESRQSLRHQFHFDVESLRRIQPATLADIQSGRKVEISTGLYLRKLPIVGPDGSTLAFNGKPYTHTTSNYRPDHIAILVNERGACGVDDGCGINNMAKRTKDTDKSPSAKKVGKYTLTESDISLGEDAAKQLKDSGHNPASWVTDEGKWEKAKKQADKGGYSGDTYWAVVAHIYKKMGGGVRNQQQTLSTPIPTPTTPTVITTPVDNITTQTQQVANAHNTGDTITMNKAQLIDWLVANCDCWKGKDDRKTLEVLDESKLRDLKDHAEKQIRNAQVANAAKAGFNDFQGNSFIYNEQTGKWEAKTPNPPIPPVNNATPPPVAPTPANIQTYKPPTTLKEWEESMPAEARGIWNAAKNVEHQERARLVQQLVAVANVADDNTRKQLADYLMTKSVPELQERLMFVPQHVQNQQHQQNANPNHPNFVGGVFAVPPGGYQNNLPYGNYGGAGSPPLTNQIPKEITDNVLETPTCDWKEWAEENSREEAARQGQ
jgi:hypothetical protein